MKRKQRHLSLVHSAPAIGAEALEALQHASDRARTLVHRNGSLALVCNYESPEGQALIAEMRKAIEGTGVTAEMIEAELHIPGLADAYRQES
jgi:hypothetical protein